jgi:lysophospholipid acyltransferase (LPLAT)-like uncharacterized protein
MEARAKRQVRRDERLRERAERAAAGRDRGFARRWRRFRRRLGDLALRTLGPVLVRLLARTWRVERRGDTGFAHFRSDRPWVLMLWHGRLLAALPLPHHAHRDIGVLVSPSDDGKLAGLALRRFGYRIIQGSASRGGSHALREMAATVAAGTPVVITPDGPRGPRHAMNSGAAWLARGAGVPLLTLGIAVDRAWRLRSWDRFVIPKPFARIVLVHGDPVTLPPGIGDEELEHVAEQARERMLADERAAFGALDVPTDH